MALGFLVHLADLESVNAGGLFAHNVDSALHALDCILGVIVVRNAYHARLDKPRVEHFLGIREGFGIGKRSLCPFETGRIDVRDGAKLKIGTLARNDVSGMTGTHVADSDYAETNFLCCRHSGHLL